MRNATLIIMITVSWQWPLATTAKRPSAPANRINCFNRSVRTWTAPKASKIRSASKPSNNAGRSTKPPSRSRCGAGKSRGSQGCVFRYSSLPLM